MTTHQTIGSACAETSKRRTRRLAAGGLALTAMLLPLGAWGIDTSPKLHFDKAGNLLPLPPIPYLDSMRWMDWKPSAPLLPLFKTDTLLLPDSAQPGFFRIPWEYERALPRMT